MNYPTPLTRVLVAGAFAAVLLTGCASEASKAQAKKDKEAQNAAVASGQYVWYTPVGSSIPILVPKDQVKASANETDQTQNTMRDVQRKGQRVQSDK